MLTMNGYPIIYNPTNKHANKDGYMYEHTYVAEKELNRPLSPEEVVHHRDGIRNNNKPENLIVFATKGDHSAFHAANCDEQRLVKLETGAYKFDFEPKTVCPLCKKSKARQSNVCIDCAKILSRKVKRPTKEELKILIRNNSFVGLGKQFGVTDKAVRKWCDLYGIPRKKTEINKYSDEEWATI